MKIAIYGRIYRDSSLSYVKDLFDALQQAQAEILIYEDYYQYLKSNISIKDKVDTFTDKDSLKGVDFLFSLGGDGTMLDTVGLVRDSGVPVIGINMGRLGFLAGINKGEIKKAIKGLFDGHYNIDKRTMVEVESDGIQIGGANIALNEVTFHQKDASSMIRVHAYLNGEFLNSYWADGLIVATPTGSTGYSLSCGGPIIFPRSGNFVITPISPHNLNVRPVIISDESILTFEIESRRDEFTLSMDSRSMTLPCSTHLAVRKAAFSYNLVRLSNENFLSTLREKLMWGLDSRNVSSKDEDKDQNR